jgi:hypothetical protein
LTQSRNRLNTVFHFPNNGGRSRHDRRSRSSGPAGTRAKAHEGGCPCGRSTAPPRRTVDCRCRSARDRSSSRDSVAPSSPIGRRSEQISPSAAPTTASSAWEVRISTDPSSCWNESATSEPEQRAAMLEI